MASRGVAAFHLSIRDPERHNRPRTLHVRQLKLINAREGAAEAVSELPNIPRPQTRSDCATTPRPCPFVSCKYHLYLDVIPATRSIKFNFPELEPTDMKESCALDVADRGGTTLLDVATMLRLTRERIRQIEAKVLSRIRLRKSFRKNG